MNKRGALRWLRNADAGEGGRDYGSSRKDLTAAAAPTRGGGGLWPHIDRDSDRFPSSQAQLDHGAGGSASGRVLPVAGRRSPSPVGPREQHAGGVFRMLPPLGLSHVRPLCPATTVIVPVVARPA